MEKQQKFITHISMGVINGKVAWVFHYHGGFQESFSLHIGVARQFMQSLQELILLLENSSRSSQDTEDRVSMQDQVSVRLRPPYREEE